jgi:hypothetical protein
MAHFVFVTSTKLNLIWSQLSAFQLVDAARITGRDFASTDKCAAFIEGLITASKLIGQDCTFGSTSIKAVRRQ